MEKISAILAILLLVSSCMVKETVTQNIVECKTDEDCVKQKYSCPISGDPPVCLDYFCSCFHHEMHTPASTNSNS
ncbi:hypothetical protein IGI04_004101 [Brassica rapa subsp. trilocularis]|uniref:Uncharacterized protein n=2 Tax=Brassica campestris TaxID=3711 RepID=A0A3P5ZD71_BRACM|nr:hypothetical protein IGI04_004101 [Brassica rapa subsp. trilocularis]CAG7890791.1 unnamed protein product [Brassica rapa]VDC78037.1 unnamed protein product [Brassica rapa]